MNQPTARQIRIWAERISASDREAFEHLFRRLYSRLVRFAFKYTRNKAAASDIVQDAFVILWEKREEADPQRSLKAFLYTMVRNRSLNYIRDHANKTVGLEAVPDFKFKTTDDQKRQNDSEKLVEHLEVWIEDLPERQREAFELSRFEGLDHNEIAKVMDISSSTVNNHIVAALRSLKDRYWKYQEAN